MHIPQLTLSTFYAHSTTDITNSLKGQSKSEIEFSLKGKLFISATCIYIVSVKSILQPPPPPAYPRYLTPLPSRGGGNLIISQPFKLLDSQLNNQSVSLSIKNHSNNNNLHVCEYVITLYNK